MQNFYILLPQVFERLAAVILLVPLGQPRGAQHLFWLNDATSGTTTAAGTPFHQAAKRILRAGRHYISTTVSDQEFKAVLLQFAAPNARAGPSGCSVLIIDDSSVVREPSLQSASRFSLFTEGATIMFSHFSIARM